MKNLFLVFLILIAGGALAQESNVFQKNSIQLVSGYSKSGTDNVGGFAFAAEYSHFFHKNLSWSVAATTSLHDGFSEVTYLTFSGLQEGSIYYSTGGFQTEFKLGYSFVKSSKHTFQGTLGPLLRYQTTSNPNRAERVYSITELFLNQPPTSTLSIGLIGSMSYTYMFDNNLFLRLLTSLQYDSNDDAFSLVGVGVGMNFGRCD